MPRSETSNRPDSSPAGGGIEIHQVDAFADRPFAGNPAAVVLLDAPVPDTWLQSVAAEMNLSETAFLLGPCEGEWGLRWMTPSTEVDLCGHATLAAAHVLWESGREAADATIRFSTRSGILHCSRDDDGTIWMDLPAAHSEPYPRGEEPELLLRALGLPEAVVVSVGRSLWDLVVEVESQRDVERVAPDMALLAAIDARGVIVTARADPDGASDDAAEVDFVSRFFGPRVGVPEDPVTGSAHCLLGPYWRRRLGERQMIGAQIGQRGGVVRLELDAEPSEGEGGGSRGDAERVRLGGRAVTVLVGRLRVAP